MCAFTISQQITKVKQYETTKILLPGNGRTTDRTDARAENTRSEFRVVWPAGPPDAERV